MQKRPILATLTSIVGGVGIYMSQIGPDDAVSNLSKWVDKVGHAPDWLKSPSVDAWGFWVFGAILASGVIWTLWAGWRSWAKTHPKTRAKEGLIDWDYKGIFGGSAGDGSHYISKFWFHGVHHEKGLLQIERAAVTSLTTGKRLELRLRTSSGYVPPSEANPIPPAANIYLDGLLYDPETRKPGEREGITADEFIQKWGGFIFSVAYSINGQASEWSKKFDYEFVRNKLAEMNPLRVPAPSVTRR